MSKSFAMFLTSVGESDRKREICKAFDACGDIGDVPLSCALRGEVYECMYHHIGMLMSVARLTEIILVREVVDSCFSTQSYMLCHA